MSSKTPYTNQNLKPWQLQMFRHSLKKQLKLKALLELLGDTSGQKCLLVTCGDNNGALNFLNEQHQATVKQKQNYQPYTVWKTPPFNRQLVEVDQNGIRHIPNANCVSGAYKILTFGGSAMWDWGSPDWGTIPAYLQVKRQTIHRQQPVCVVNFSENAYVSTQEIIRLTQELKAENVPDMVIFYDGVNDVMAAHQSKQPGTHQSLNDIATRFKNPEHPLVTWLKESNSAQLLGRVVDRFRSRNNSTNANIDVDINQLAAATTEAYLANYKIVEVLAQTYGFDYYFFWQPYIRSSAKVGRLFLTKDERRRTNYP